MLSACQRILKANKCPKEGKTECDDLECDEDNYHAAQTIHRRMKVRHRGNYSYAPLVGNRMKREQPPFSTAKIPAITNQFSRCSWHSSSTPKSSWRRGLFIFVDA